MTLNTAAWINKLPVELLVSIFNRLSTNNIRTCSHVCRWWRLTALDNPPLWQNIDIRFPPPPLTLTPSPTVMLSLSRNQPLVLHLAFPFETTRMSCMMVAHAVKSHAGRLSELRITLAPGRQAIALQPVIDLFEPSGSMPNLKSIDIFVQADRALGGPYLECPPLDHLTSLVAYSIEGPVAYTYGMAPITPRLRAIRLPEPNILLDDDEEVALSDAFMFGTTLEQLSLGTTSFYGPLARKLSMSASQPSPGGALKYVFWPSEALVGPCDFRTLCRWTKARVADPVHFALEGANITPIFVRSYFLYYTPTALQDSGYIGHANNLAASILPNSKTSRVVNLKFAGEDGETWFLPRCSGSVTAQFFSPGNVSHLNLVQIDIHENLWGDIKHKEFPFLRDLTVFVDDRATLLRESVRPPLDETDEAVLFLRIMDISPYWVVPKLRQFRIAAFNSHPARRSLRPMDEKLRFHVQLQHPATLVSVPAEAVTAFIATHLVDAVLPLERLVMQDIQCEGSMWGTAEEIFEYAVKVKFESTQDFAPAGLVPFVFIRDADLCEMYCTQ